MVRVVLLCVRGFLTTFELVFLFVFLDLVRDVPYSKLHLNGSAEKHLRKMLLVRHSSCRSPS